MTRSRSIRPAGFRRIGWIAALSAALLCTGGWVAPARADGSRFAIIVSNDWADLQDVDATVLRRIYLGKVGVHAGQRVAPIHQQPESPIRAGFNARVLRKSQRELSSYWIQQALSGGARPPLTAESEAEVVLRVRREVGAIGYVDAERLEREAPSGVRAIPIVIRGRALTPSDPEYRLTY